MSKTTRSPNQFLSDTFAESLLLIRELWKWLTLPQRLTSVASMLPQTQLRTHGYIWIDTARLPSSIKETSSSIRKLLKQWWFKRTTVMATFKTIIMPAWITLAVRHKPIQLIWATQLALVSESPMHRVGHHLLRDHPKSSSDLRLPRIWVNRFLHRTQLTRRQHLTL